MSKIQVAVKSRSFLVARFTCKDHDNPKRKTQYSLIAVEKGALLINMDSQAPNKVVQEWLQEQEPFW